MIMALAAAWSTKHDRLGLICSHLRVFAVLKRLIILVQKKAPCIDFSQKMAKIMRPTCSTFSIFLQGIWDHNITCLKHGQSRLPPRWMAGGTVFELF